MLICHNLNHGTLLLNKLTIKLSFNKTLALFKGYSQIPNNRYSIDWLKTTISIKMKWYFNL